jgi:hypothetical protein
VARGWESKSIEQQQDEARSSKEPKRRLSPAQRAAESRKEGLRLSRNRILQQLQSAVNANYRKTLEQSLAAIEEEIHRLG